MRIAADCGGKQDGYWQFGQYRIHGFTYHCFGSADCDAADDYSDRTCT